MDAMLMGGILPNDINERFVDQYLAKNTRRKKKVQFNGTKYSANNWKQILVAILPREYYERLLNLLTQYLRTTANYAISGGPRGVEALGVIRHLIANQPAPIPQLIVRIIRDMRTLRPSIKKVRRQMFIREPNPVKALGYMQFIPSLGVYNDSIRTLPMTYARKLQRYIENQGLRRRAAARALIKARNITGIPDYMPDLMGTTPLSQEAFLAPNRLDPRIREMMRWTPGRNPNTDPAILERLERGRRTAQANLDRAMAQVHNMPGIWGTFEGAQEVAQAAAARAAAARAAQQALSAQAADSIPSSPPYVPSSPPTPPRRPQGSVPILPGNPPGYDPIDGEY